tara:strand:- start:3643 stop:3852 length:210 start_codon:yes stop_codon:yes gene_type:complete
MSSFDKNIPRQTRDRYGFAAMKVGDSFIYKSKNRTSVYWCALQATRRLSPKLFKAGYDAKHNQRIWREK